MQAVVEAMFYLLPYDLRRSVYSVVRRNEFDRLQLWRNTELPTGYSYKPFVDNGCIFVHIPKAAGTSVSRTLFGNLAGGHTRVVTYQVAFSRSEFNRFFKFTFVRNPWDRVFSAYNFLLKGGFHEEDRQWAADNLMCYRTFEDFVGHGLLNPVIRRQTLFLPQHQFLCCPLSDKLSVDFVGFFENIADDFEYARNRLRLPPDVTLRHENATFKRNRDFREAYTDEMRDIVAQLYERDIRLLGYNFDNSSLSSQLANRSRQIC